MSPGSPCVAPSSPGAYPLLEDETCFFLAIDFDKSGHCRAIAEGAARGWQLWPQDVPPPVEPAWKRDYSGSVLMLAQDGVDTSLASLFVHAARPLAPDAEGADRARSATEAFLYRRLETLPQTRGRFRLNAVLPIAFDGLGQLEVDLLCDDAPTTASPWNSTATSISPTRSPTAGTAARTCCCMRTATSFCVFSRRTWAGIWTACSTPSSERSLDGKGPQRPHEESSALARSPGATRDTTLTDASPGCNPGYESGAR